MTNEPMTMLLVPGAWMGGWIWEGTIEDLRDTGATAHTLTLPGLSAGSKPAELADVHLEDHVDAAVNAARDAAGPLMVVGHSYSGLIAGMVADREPEIVQHTVIISGFFPRDGVALIDDWGTSSDGRTSERADIEDAGMVWAPPPSEGVRTDEGLDEQEAQWLSQRLTPHPGRTVLEPATMVRPITEQNVTVIADVGGEGDPRSTLPDDLAGEDLGHWEFRTLPPGHWPMLGHAARLREALLETAVQAATRTR